MYLQVLPVLERADARVYLKGVFQGLCRIYSQAKEKQHLLLYLEKHFNILQPQEYQEQVHVLQTLAQLCTNMNLREKNFSEEFVR